jgi:hypothetical protein
MTVAVATPHTLPITDRRNIGVFPTVSECTVVQAAEILDVPAACVNSWLNLGRITFRQENEERLIQLDCLLDFEEQWKRRQAALAELFHMFQEAGMSDD